MYLYKFSSFFLEFFEPFEEYVIIGPVTLLHIFKDIYWQSFQYLASKMFAHVGREKLAKYLKISQQHNQLLFYSHFPDRHLQWPKVQHLST